MWRKQKAMSNSFEIVSVNVSVEKGTAKHPVPEAVVDDRGIVGDSHSGPWHRQVSMLSRESIDRFSSEANRRYGPGDFAENITTRGIDLGAVALLDRFRAGEVGLEVTQIGKECHGDGCAIYRESGRATPSSIFRERSDSGSLR